MRRAPTAICIDGHAFSALLNQRAAEATGGRFLLRIEDIDQSRARPAFEAAIYEDLGWLGLHWEEPVLRQSERTDAYRAALQRLDRLGLVYPSFLSRAEISARVTAAEAIGSAWPRDPDGAPLYAGEERDWSQGKRTEAMASGAPYALRLDMARALQDRTPLAWQEVDPFGREPAQVMAADPAAWGDVILARKDMPGSYHLSVVVDDAFQGVSDVVRGLDLKPATAVHRLLQTLLALPEPRYFHHRLVLDATGAKLAKSRGSETIRRRREAGESPQAVIAALPL